MARTVKLMPEDDNRPKDLDAERAVLGAVLVTPDLWPEVAARVAQTDFFREAHQTIYVALGAIFGRGASPDIVTLADALGSELASVGGRLYLAGLVDGVPRSANASHYADIVREKARQRDLAALAERLLANALVCEEPAVVLVEQTVRALDRVIEAEPGGLVDAKTAVTDYVAELSDPTERILLPTGLRDLDALIKGFRPGNLIIVAARPSTGKTSLALGMGRAIAQAGHHTLFFSLEMSPSELSARMLAWDSGVTSDMLESGHASEYHYAQVAKAMEEPTVPLFIHPRAKQASVKTVTEIGAWCRRVKHEHRGLRCVIVDYLQLLMAERRRDSDEAEIAGISAALKRLARDLDIVVIALSQLNRAPEGRKDKRPSASDLRGSGALEQDCDKALLIFREEIHAPTPDNKGIAEIIVAKNRNGAPGVVRVVFLSELTQFRDLAPRQGGF